MKRRTFIRTAAAGMAFSFLNPGCAREPSEAELAMAQQAVTSDPWLGEIGLVAFPYAPAGWALCAGQLLPIAQNQPLYALLGTNYGGNGQTNFALPDLRGRVAQGAPTPGAIGSSGGAETVVLEPRHLPVHSHSVPVAAAATQQNMSAGTLVAATTDVHRFAEPAPGESPASLAAASIASAPAGSQAHENRQPSLVLHYVIALQGIFPSPA